MLDLNSDRRNNKALPLQSENSNPFKKIFTKLRNKKVMLAFFLVVFTCLILFIFNSRGANAPSTSRTEAPKNTTENKVTADHIRLIATGDTIAHDALNAAAMKSDGSYDYYKFIQPMQSIFDKADVRFCNQAVPGGGVEFGIKGYPVFNSPLEVADGLNKLGCNVVNTGTNHTFDYGQAVIDAELNHWDRLPKMLAVAGANRSASEQSKIRYFEVKGIKFAFLSYSTYSNSVPPNNYGLNMFNQEIAQNEITEARKNADVILVSMRWGTEYASTVNNEQTRIGQLLADWGADIVLGHGPHVLEPMKIVNGANGHTTQIWYSIGNFLNAQIPVESLVSGVAVIDIDLATKKPKAPALLPIYMHYEWTAAEKTSEDLLKRHSFTLVPLDTAEELLAKSQNNTSVQAQTKRVTDLLNQYTAVKMLDSKTY